MGNKPIRTQFLLVFLSFVVLLVGFIFIVNIFFLKPFYVWTKTEQLKSISYDFDGVAIEQQNAAFRQLMENTMYESQVTIDIFASDKSLLYSSRNPRESNQANLRSISKATDWDKLQHGSILVQERKDPRRNQEFLTIFRVLPGGQILSLSAAMAAIEQSVSVLNQFLLMILVVFFFVAWMFATRLASYFSQPIIALQQLTHRIIQFDFRQRWMEERGDELGDLGKNMNKLMAIIGQFIEELRGKNEVLESELERKTRMERMQRQFVSNVSHELKTPIALIQGYAEGLRQNVNEDPESKNEYCDVIIDEARKMNELVRELLLLSQLESGQAALIRDVFDIQEAIQTTVSRLQSLYVDKGIQFELLFQEQTCMVTGDLSKINQVFNNYLTNAVFYLNERKRIGIQTEVQGSIARISVFNTGPHIPEGELELIWTSFYKVDKARTRGEGGTGLGLSIVKTIMNLHQMGYGAENVEDGVVFWFELPLAQD